MSLDIVGPTIGLIGESERDAIVADAARCGVADRVNLRGPVPLDQLMPMYRDYDLFVLPTRPGEGIPRVLLEAMADGLPVVTTDVSGIASLITDGENGRLVTGESRPAMVDAVNSLITDAGVAAPADPGRLRHRARLHARAPGRRDDADCRPRPRRAAARCRLSDGRA